MPIENKSFSLSVFFPFYDEEENIRPTIKEAIKVLKSIKEISKFQIIIVDDGSKDKTKEIAENLAKKYPDIKVISHLKNLGYGSALISGIHNCFYDYIFFTDGDLQFDFKEIEKLLEFIPEYEVVIGYRFPRRDPFMRILNGLGWNLLNRIFFGLKVKDIDCAFKLFKREAVVNLPIISGGAMVSAEILIRLHRKGIKIKEVAVSHFPRKKGSPTGAKPSVIFRALKEFFYLYVKI